jgi:hypothetical protein
MLFSQILQKRGWTCVRLCIVRSPTSNIVATTELLVNSGLRQDRITIWPLFPMDHTNMVLPLPILLQQELANLPRKSRWSL